MSQSSFITELGRKSSKSELINSDEHKQYSYRDFRSENQKGRKINEPARIVEAKKNIQMYGMQVMNNLYELKNQIDPLQSKRSYINHQVMLANIEEEKQTQELMQLKQRLKSLQQKNIQSITKLNLSEIDVIRAQDELKRSKQRLTNLLANQKENPGSQKIKKQVQLAKKQYSVASIQFLKCERQINALRHAISFENKVISSLQEQVQDRENAFMCLRSQARELRRNFQDRQSKEKQSIKAENYKFQNENTKSKTSNRKSMNNYDE